MPPIKELIDQIKNAFAQYSFQISRDFCWSSGSNTIFHLPIRTKTEIRLLLHEIAHAKLNHHDYGSDVNLIRYEVEAWDYAKNTLAPLFKLNIDDAFIDKHLNTYRQWLDQRSTCPRCSATGIETRKSIYGCINCRCSWSVNDARLYGLKRKLLNRSFTAPAL